ncbi:MAG: hypothetical protein OHK0029_33130 [Armatimonadaceae bacterium]
MPGGEAVLPAVYALRYGTLEPLAETVMLAAGPLTMEFDPQSGDLRNLRVGGETVLMRLYAAVRDRNWGTVTGQVTVQEQTVRADSFRLVFVSEHRDGEIHFVWQATIDGAADGTLTFDFEGEAKTTFHRNRIGFCLLHPADFAGQSCTLEHTDGSTEEATFPYLINPDQPVLPFADLRAITQPLASGADVELRMEGDTFEMEDQRNWTDASYKTFCTPLALPYPVEVPAGTRVQQRVTVRVAGLPETESGGAVAEGNAVYPLYAPGQEATLPVLGSVIRQTGAVTEAEMARLRRLNLQHLRCDVRFEGNGWRVSVARAGELARRLGIPLEAALYLPAESDGHNALLTEFAAAVREAGATIGAWLIYPAQEVYAGQPWMPLPVEQLRELAPDAAIGTGSDTDFIFFNRLQGEPAGADFVSVQINPQIHAFDNASLMETLTVQGAVVESARQKASGSIGVGISPVTLKPRYNSYATVPNPPPIPPDPRQKTLLGAAWTLGSIRALTEAGAARATFYETNGDAGVQNATGVYPLWFVLAWLGEKRHEPAYPLLTANPLVVTGLRLGNRTLIANLTNAPVTASLVPLSADGARVRVKYLDERHVVAACREPERFLADPWQELPRTNGELSVPLLLLPYAVACIEEDI